MPEMDSYVKEHLRRAGFTRFKGRDYSGINGEVYEGRVFGNGDGVDLSIINKEGVLVFEVMGDSPEARTAAKNLRRIVELSQNHWMTVEPFEP